MKKLRALILIGLLIAFSTAGLMAQAPAAQAPAKPAVPDIQALDRYIASELEARGLVGLSAAVMIDGKIVLAKGYGRAAVGGATATAETPFAIGSITKQFTCACILKLAEAGKLQVTDKVAKYYPGLTRAADITLLDLMNHVSGYHDYYPLDFVDRPMAKPIEADELIRRFAGRPLDFEPGSRYSYSNTGFVILGRVVEKVSGRPFGRFLTEEVLAPLGLSHTFYEPDPNMPGLAQGYTTFATGDPEPATPEARDWIAAAGAIYSTAADLAAWDLALMTGKLLKPTSYALMTGMRQLTDGRTSFYGCGLALSFRNRRFVLSHGGAVEGFVASNLAVPSTRSAAVLLSNYSGGGPSAIFDKLVEAVLPAPTVDIPTIAGPPAVEAQKRMLAAYQAGKVDRARLGEEFSYYLTEAKLRTASLKLKPYGEPAKADVESVNERGGMEVSVVRFTFANGTLRGLMYRTPDGKIQQFFVSKT
ncbi:MAG TPA: serine hydrolase domain-containing protein [Terriglobales bacterium]|nr:serine hydrolase domain-containing protein [Terriglobales bacterium]